MLGKHIHLQKNEIAPLFYTIHKKVNSELIKDLNTIPEYLKLLEKNLGENQSIGSGNNFLDMTPKALGTNAKIDK